MLEENRDKIDAMADALMLYETIDADQIDDIMAGRTPRPPKDWNGPSAGGKAAATDARPAASAQPGKESIGGPANTH